LSSPSTSVTVKQVKQLRLDQSDTSNCMLSTVSVCVSENPVLHHNDIILT